MGLFSRPPATHLPPVEGVRMDGTPFALPDPAAPATLVVVSFEDDAAPLAGQWTRLGLRLADDAPRLAVADVLVVPPRLRLLGDMALLSLHARAEREAAQARTAAVYTKRKPLRNVLGIDSPVTVFLVGPDGAIAWRGEGEIDLHEVEALEPALAALLAPKTSAPEAGAAEASATGPV